ncbi:MAG: recombination protein RecR [Actinomycetota bacterium]|nr:recombination protein RecR [Actinomycetota bacterium]
MYAPPVSRLIAELSKLPGIGGRTAQRLAFHLLRASDEDALALSDAIREVKARIGLCEVCFNLADGPRCRFCSDERRDPDLICVVEAPSDVISIERTHEFRGRYHVLGGALSPIDGIDPEDLKIAELYARVAPGDGATGDGAASGDGLGDAQEGGAAGGGGSPGEGVAPGGGVGRREVREVVIATNPTTTGEATALHIAEALRVLAPGVSVTRLASGLPVGSDLEYADELTLGRALAGRRAV